LQIIHAALDHGKYFAFLSYIILALKNDIFWSVTPCSPVEVYIHFGGMYSLYYQFQRGSQASKQTVSE
jgi:hypothetical protein